MYPLGHFMLAALPLLAYAGIRYRRLPRGHTLLLVLLATQLPDLIDKPLAWTFGVIPSGRMLAHSLVIAVPLLTLGCVLAVRRGFGRAGGLFAMAYLSHLVGDFYQIFWQGSEYYFFPNLFWPLLAANPDHRPSFAAHAPPTLGELLLPLGLFTLVVGYIILDIAYNRPAIIQRLRRTVSH